MDKWVFEITDISTGSTIIEVIDNPLNWDKVKFTMQRDKQKHGIFTDFSIQDLEYSGRSAEIIEAAYLAKGIEAITTISITWDCDITQLLYEGKLNYHSYKKTCSLERGCWITIQMETPGALMKLKSREDQKVNLDATTDFAGDVLSDYAGLGREITLASKGILLTDKANRTTQTSYDISNDPASQWQTIRISGNLGSVAGHQNVPFEDVILDETPDISIETDNLFVQNANYGSGGPQTRQVYEHNNTNITSVQLELRIKGRIIWDFGTATLEIPAGLPLKIFAVTLAGGIDPNFNLPVILGSQTIKAPNPFNTDITTEFDFILNTSFSVNEHQKIWFFIQWNLDKTTTGIFDITTQYDSESYFTIKGLTYAPPTPCKVYLINESFSRIVESITDGEMRVISDYFGRTDSQPYAMISDGCGSLECITKGLLIRQASIQGNDPIMSVSLKDLSDAFKAIHNIGIGLEDDDHRTPYSTYKRIRIEPFDYFYQNDILLNCVAVNTLEIKTEVDGFISTFKFGYSKYEGEEYNGIDEFLSQREYRSQISQNNQTLDATCKFIASGYAIEITRRKETTTKDWRLDNDFFVICLSRLYGGFYPELGNIDFPSNIIDPPTIYNYRISPLRNALRWAKILFAQQFDDTIEYKFTNGTGNYFAQGVVTGGCVVERNFAPNSEMGNINYFTFGAYTDCTPLWINERVKYSYPLTAAQYDFIKSNPYGKIGYSFANKPLSYGWIDKIDYEPNSGMADFVLIPVR